jgi:hypothetical protein
MGAKIVYLTISFTFVYYLFSFESKTNKTFVYHRLSSAMPPNHRRDKILEILKHRTRCYRRRIQTPTLSLTSQKAADFFTGINAQKLFLATARLSLKAGLTYPSFSDIVVKKG